MAQIKASALAKYLILEEERGHMLKQVFTTLSNVNRSCNSRALIDIDQFDETVKNIDLQIDLQTETESFLSKWPEMEPILFENFKNKLPAKGSSIFNIL